MNRTQIFRVLYYLHKEPSPLMLAQDAYVIAQQCRVQLDGLGAILTDWKRQEAEGVTEITKCIAEAEATIELLPELSSLFKEIQDEAYTIWMCATVDKSKLAKGTAPALWEKHVAGRDPLPPELEEAIAAFRSHVFAKIELHFPELLELMRNEEDQARIDVSSFTVHPSNLLNVVPVVCQQQQWHSTQVYWCSSCFPQTHVRACSPNFPKHLGYSLARVLCTPVSQIVVNSSFITEVLDDLNRGVEIEQRPTIQFSYRTNARTIRTCQWEMCSELINGSFTAVGIDITSELESFNESSSANTQRMLRQWLHSIRNASFEQQAAILLDELNELRAAMGHRKGLESRFNSLTEGLTMLMKTAERSVGLIDHALDTKGFIQLLSVHDFVTNLAVFPSGDDIKVKVPKSVKQTAFKVTCLLNDVKVEPDEVSGLFVKCDIINIQNLVAKLIVACAR